MVVDTLNALNIEYAHLLTPTFIFHKVKGDVKTYQRENESGKYYGRT